MSDHWPEQQTRKHGKRLLITGDDLTIIYYSACVLPPAFQSKVWEQLEKAAQGMPIIAVTQHPMPVEHNIVVDLPRHHLSIYRQALIGAKEADTEYIALAEDDVLYSPQHFKQRPKDDSKFAYNFGFWNIFTWGEPIFSHKGGSRRNLGQLICRRDLFIEAMEERFEIYPDDEVDLRLWAEPGKYERQLGVTVRESEQFFTNPPNIVFSHQTALSYDTIGEKKRLGEFRAYEIPYWNRAEEIRKFYDSSDR